MNVLTPLQAVLLWVAMLVAAVVIVRLVDVGRRWIRRRRVAKLIDDTYRERQRAVRGGMPRSRWEGDANA